MSARQPSICILRLSAIGDVCHALPTLHALRQQWPDNLITWIIGKTEYQLVKEIPNIDFIIFDKSQKLAAYRQLQQKLSRCHFDILLHMQTSLRANLAALFISADRKIGYHKARAKEFHSLVCNEHLPTVKNQHQVEDMLDFARYLGISVDKAHWQLPLTAQAQSFAQQIIDKKRATLLINPCSSASNRVQRSWPVNNYTEICRRATDELNMQVILCGGPTEMEKQIAAKIRADTGSSVQNLAGQTSLQELAAIIKQADVLISSDSGPVHIAVAMQTDVIALHGVTNPQQTGPYHSQWMINHYPQNLEKYLHKSIQSVPWGKRITNEHAMEDISVNEVWQKLLQWHQQINSSSKKESGTEVPLS